jgi:hypothetical protein
MCPVALLSTRPLALMPGLAAFLFLTLVAVGVILVTKLTMAIRLLVPLRPLIVLALIVLLSLLFLTALILVFCSAIVPFSRRRPRERMQGPTVLAISD